MVGLGAAAYPSARDYLERQRAPEVEVARATSIAPPQGAAPVRMPVLAASGYVVARRSSEVGVKIGGRIETLTIEEGTRVRAGEVIAKLEHADLDAQLKAAQAAVLEAETGLAEAIAVRDENVRQLERERALARDGITTQAALTASEAAAAVAAARVKTAEAAIVSANARVAVSEEALENTNVRAPFDGVVIKKRAELGETVSPFGVAGQATREGGAIATIADLRELEVQTEVSESNVAKLARNMPATVSVQAYRDREYRGRIRDIFPSADRAKAIVEVRVSILDADRQVKPEMTASVTFEESRPEASAVTAGTAAPGPPGVLVPKRAIATRGGKASVWIVTGERATRRTITPGPERLDQVEVEAGVAPGEAVLLNPPGDLPDQARVRVRGS